MLRVNRSKGGGVALHKDSIDEGYPAAAVGCPRLDELARRIFDLLAATMCLILFAPILLLTSIAIKLESLAAQYLSARCGTDTRTKRFTSVNFA